MRAKLFIGFLMLFVLSFSAFAGGIYTGFVNSTYEYTTNITAQYIFANGSQLSDVCLANGTFCSSSGSISPSTNLVINNLTVANNVSALYFIGNGSLLTGISSSGFVYSSYFNQALNSSSNSTSFNMLNVTNTTNTNILQVNTIRFVQPVQQPFNNCSSSFNFSAVPVGADSNWIPNQNLTYQIGAVGFDETCGGGNSCFQPFDWISVTGVGLTYTSPHFFNPPDHTHPFLNFSFNATANGIYPINITFHYNGGGLADCNINASIIVNVSNQFNTITGDSISASSGTLSLNFDNINGKSGTLTNINNINSVDAYHFPNLIDFGGVSVDNLFGLMYVFGIYDGNTGKLLTAGTGTAKMQSLNLTGTSTALNLTNANGNIDTPYINVRTIATVQNETIKGNLTIGTLASNRNLSINGKNGVSWGFKVNTSCTINFTSGVLTSTTAGC